MELKRVAPSSAFKVAAGIYGGIGLLIGCLFSLFAVVGAGIAGGFGSDSSLLGAVFGIGAIIILPVVYGLLAGIMFTLVAALYNLVARHFGGLRVELE